MTELVDFGVRCPTCKTGLLTPAPGTGGDAHCGRCFARYRLRDGFLDLLPPSKERPTAAQALMQWPPLIEIYESRFWRRSPLFTVLAGISFEGEYSLIAEAVGLEPHQRVLDLACGPGIYARRFARAVPQGGVVGLDLSAPMLRYASRKARSESLDNLLLLRASAMELPFEAGRFDAVNCCGALHLFSDVARVLREVERVLSPGGQLTVAAVRRGHSALAAQRSRLRRRIYGVDAFTPSELASRFEGAGLSAPRCLHAAGLWVIMSARKPIVETE